MTEALVQVVLDNLNSLILKEIGSFMGADNEMKKLCSTLTAIQAVLEDAEEKQLQSKVIRNWLCKLNDLAYEIEDVLDECATEASILEHKHGILILRILKKILNRFRVGSRMREMTEKLNALAAECDMFHLRTWDKERQSKAATTRETGSVLNEPDRVYGRDEEKEKIVDILVNRVRDSQQLSILPIVGIGGLGKTTLAQLVYNDPRVTRHFEEKVWVCVSDNFDIKTLVKAMIESATGNESVSNNFNALQRRLWELLNQKRYLLILDDLWNDEQEKWYKLKDILACGSRGASIVVTTRLKKVADITQTLPAHHLSGLSEEDCWLLFRQRALGQEVKEHPKLEAIGKEIVKKCAGVPLAATTLGGLLRFKRKEIEWVYVKDSDIWNLPQEENLIMPALRLSYQHLPLQLRNCFAYCAVYPKDYEIRKEELIFCWMAHGYISSNGRMDVEEVGNEVWEELVLRSIFQDVRTGYGLSDDGGQFGIYTKIHDLVHDLARSIMENKVPGEQMERSDQSASNNNQIRQVILRKRLVAFPMSYQQDMDMSSILQNFRHVRMLDVSRNNMEDLPSEIDKLKRLRYLNLSGCDRLVVLPDSVCDLWNLEILNLYKCMGLVELPKHMRSMKNLRHLILEQCHNLREMPPKIGELNSLKTLSQFVVGHKNEIDNQLDQLQHLKLGGRLYIKHLERVQNDVDAKKANIGEKPNLRDLVLRWKSEKSSEQQQEMDEKVLGAFEPHSYLETLEIHGFMGRHFPTWTKMDNIIKFSIQDFPNCLRLPPLGNLPCLKVLELSNLDALEYVMENEVQGVDQVKEAILFPSLEKLDLKLLPKLKGLLKEERRDIFPILQELSISGCHQLELPPPLSVIKLTSVTSLTVGFKEDVRTCILKEFLGKFPNLKKLSILEAEQHHLAIEGLEDLNNLKELSIQQCRKLTCLPNGLWRHLTALERLDILRCRNLVEFTEDIRFLHSLSRLSLSCLAKLECLPEVLQHLSPTLQSLSLHTLPMLVSLPDWFGKLASLEHLSIRECPKLTSLPASVQGMTNLRTLRISGRKINPELKRRCERGKGEDWHIIAKIPNLSIIQDKEYGE